MKSHFRKSAAAVACILLAAPPGGGWSAEGEVASAGISVKSPKVDAKSRKLGNLRKIAEKDGEGGFIRPRFSPDGLQLMVSRPGFRGIHVVAAAGGKPTPVSADANAFNARWTKDGLIAVPAQEEGGKTRILNLDGSEARVEPAAPDAVFCKNDRVFSTIKDGGAEIAISDASDRFLAPQLCPKHVMVSFMGLQSGLYLTRGDGSGKPVFLGEGEDLAWAPDSSFVVFTRARDDGHAVVESHLYQFELKTKKLFDLSADSRLIINTPSLSPDGKTVAFEVDRAIFVAAMPER